MLNQDRTASRPVMDIQTLVETAEREANYV